MGWPSLCSFNPASWLAAPFNRKEAAARQAVEGEAAGAARGGDSSSAKVLPTQEWWELPGCVQKGLERVGAKGDDFTLVTAQQVGKFRHGQDKPWRDLSATQVASPRVPAFFWTARLGFLKGMWLRGFDCRAGAKGWVDWRFWGWLPALSGRGLPTDRALLVRWLAEAPGYPQALLPSPLLRWQPVQGQDLQARALLTHGGTTVDGTFSFDQEGLVTGFRSDDYTRPVPGGGVEQRPWVVRYSEHRLTPVEGAPGGERLVPTRYRAFRVEADGTEYCYADFSFAGLAAR